MFVWHGKTGRFYSLIGLIWASAGCVSAVYDPQNPPRRPNYDPAEANPYYKPTCIGPLPPYRFPVWPHWDPNIANLQQICASEQYGGFQRGPGGPARTANVYCIPPTDPELSQAGMIVVDGGIHDAHLGETVASSRLFLYCKYRCFCNHGNEDATMKPPAYVRRPYSIYKNSYHHGEVRIDDLNIYDQHRNQPELEFAITRDERPIVPIQNFDQYILQIDPSAISRIQSQDIAMWPGNQITCRDGDLPDFDLPPPYTMTDFHSIQELCAVEWSDGNPFANAGAYCHPDPYKRLWGYRYDMVESGPSGDVWFSDEFTPRFEWTWDNFRASARIRYFCWSQCYCNQYRRPEERAAYNFWRSLNSVDIIRMFGRYGADVYPQSSSDSDDESTSGQGGGGTVEGANQCTTVDGVDTCKLEPWPVDLLGPKPGVDIPLLRSSLLHHDPKLQNPYDSTSIPTGTKNLPFLLPGRRRHHRPRPGSFIPNDLDVCGTTCLGPAACPGAATTVGCECIAIGPGIANYLGYTIPESSSSVIGRCFQVAAYHALLVSLSKDQASTNRLGGRAMNVEVEPWDCLCNATFSAPSCCTFSLADFGI